MISEILSSTVPLVYTDISGTNQYTNVLLIDNSVPDYQIFVDSVNVSTFPVVYSTSSTKSDVLAFLQSYFTTIPRIGMCFTSSSGGPKTFLDNEPFFTDDEPVPYSANLQFILDIITEFQVKNIDYLACDTLGYPNWKNYYDVLMNNTGVIVGASSDQTGNIFYGGDWVLESTNEDVELMYFTQNIEYYSYLLDTLSWATSANGLSNCIGIALYNGYLYVNNYGNNRIIKINPNNANDYSIWFNGFGILANNYGIVYYNGYFYVGSYSANKITRINADNPADYVDSWGTLGVIQPLELTVYDNDLYIVCNNNTGGTASIIVRINITTPSTVYPIFATSAQGLIDTRGIVYHNGYFYTTNVDKIVRIDTAGNSTDNWATSTQGLNATGNAAMVVYGNYLYVSIWKITFKIVVINLDNPTTQYISSWVTGLNGPLGMCLYNKYLYVANYTGSTISLITSLANWATPSNALNGCVGITLYNGYFYVTNYSKNSIIKINVDNASDYSVWATAGLSSPFGIVYYSGYFYVVNHGGGGAGSYINKIDATNPNTYDATWANNATQGLYGSFGLTIYDGYLYVCNNGNSIIIKIDTADATATTFATSASGLGDLVGPKCITYYNNYFYVSNTAKIVRIDTAGVSTNNWATTTQGLDATATVDGLAIYDNCLYVSNWTSNKIVIINFDNPTTQYNTSWPVSISEINSPREMYVYNDNLYVCNYGNSTIYQIPLEKGFFWFTLGGASGLTINGNYLYASNFLGGQITRIDINDPTNYILDWVTISGTTIRGLANDGTYIYAPDSINYQINRILISDPTQIVIGWATSAQGVSTSECRQVHVNGDYLYTTSITGGNISKISLADPTGPNTVPIWKAGFGYQGITSDRNYIYVSANESTGIVSKVSLTDPTTSVSGGGANGNRGCVVFDNNLYFAVQTVGGIYTVTLPNITNNGRGGRVTTFKRNFPNYYEQTILSYPYIFSSNISSGYISRFKLPTPLQTVISGNGYIIGNGFFIENS